MDTFLSSGGENPARTQATDNTKLKVPNSQKGPKTSGIVEDNDSDVDSEVEAQEQALDLKGKGKAKVLKAFEQRDLVALAFAGDNVVHVILPVFWRIKLQAHVSVSRISKKRNGVRSLRMRLAK